MSKAWFPGHMQKAVRLLKDSAPHLDLLVIVLDARIPFTSRNIILEKIFRRPGKLFILNKADLAAPDITRSWLEYFTKSGFLAEQAGEKNAGSLKNILSSKAKKRSSGGIFKVMVVGIPNVGKSSIINRLSRGGRAKVADLPGTTRGKQWIRLGENIALLDSPGVIPPAVENDSARWRLAACGCLPIKGDLAHNTAVSLLEYMKKHHREGMPALPDDFTTLAADKHFLLPGGEPDSSRAEIFFLKKFGDGAPGRYSLEIPDST